MRNGLRRALSDDALRGSEGRYRILLDLAPDAVLVIQDERIVYCNAAALRLYGAERDDQLRGGDPLVLVHPEERETVRVRIRSTLAGCSMPLREFRHRRLDGQEVPVEALSAPVDWHGKPAVQVFIRDIAERKQTERERAEHLKSLEFLSTSATRFLELMTSDEMFRYAAQQLRAVAGRAIVAVSEYRAETNQTRVQAVAGPDETMRQLVSLLGRDPTGMVFTVADGTRQRMVKGKLALVEGGLHDLTFYQVPLPLCQEIERRLDLGAVYAMPFVLGEDFLGTVALMTRRDEGLKNRGAIESLVNQIGLALKRKRVEEEIEHNRSQLQKAKEAADAANQAKDRFLAMLSHELRTPLTPVLIATGILERDARLPEAVRKEMAMIRRNVLLETRLIDDLLDLTRIARDKMDLDLRPVDVAAVLWQTVAICSADLRAKALRLHLDLGPVSHPVLADTVRLHQVFWNLLKNAIKFTPDGGRIDIRCRATEPRRARIEVQDDGIGIEPERLPYLFTPFEQGERSRRHPGGGLGLGLSISKALVTLHGGTLNAHSDGPGRGATFVVDLPLTDRPAPDAEPPRPAEPPVAAGTAPLSILLVEDHADTAQLIGLLLRDDGHNVQMAGGVAEALARFRERHIDLVLSDLGLPDGSGHDLMRHLLALRPDLQAIALSGYGADSDLRMSRDAGFAEHLTKPVSVERLREAIARAASARRGGRGTA
jgi:PAS domain S-box-containing protein